MFSSLPLLVNYPLSVLPGCLTVQGTLGHLHPPDLTRAGVSVCSVCLPCISSGGIVGWSSLGCCVKPVSFFNFTYRRSSSLGITIRLAELSGTLFTVFTLVYWLFPYLTLHCFVLIFSTIMPHVLCGFTVFSKKSTQSSGLYCLFSYLEVLFF